MEESLPLAGLAFRGGRGTPHRRREDGWEDPSVTPSPGSLVRFAAVALVSAARHIPGLGWKGGDESQAPTSTSDSHICLRLLRRRGHAVHAWRRSQPKLSRTPGSGSFQESQRVAPRWLEGARTLGVVPSAPSEVGELQMGSSETPCPHSGNGSAVPLKLPVIHTSLCPPPTSCGTPAWLPVARGTPVALCYPVPSVCTAKNESASSRELCIPPWQTLGVFLNCTRRARPSLPASQGC